MKLCASTLALVCVLVATATAASNPVVTVTGGKIEGLQSDIGTQFLGIPFAQPPVGDLRWQPPQAPTPWSGKLNTTTFGPGCPQRCALPPLTCPTVQSEDCLQLNVYAPVPQPGGEPVPVMVFFPGGHFQQGTSATYLYYGDVLANYTNTVVIVTNYRLGALGWLVNTDAGMAGNYGFMDQQMAMKWAQDNAAVFGGDPSRVTIFGQSAGANSVNGHLVSPSSQPLFNNAIVESSCFGIAALTNKTGDDYGKDFAKTVNCDEDDFGCLQALSVQDIIDAEYEIQTHLYLSHPLQLFLPWDINVDGDLIPIAPLEAYLEGSGLYPKPLISGNVQNEAVMFIWQADSKPLSAFEYEAIVFAIFNIHAPHVLEMFPANATDNRLMFAFLGSSYIFECPTRVMMKGSAAMVADTYLYHFDHVWSFADIGWGPNYTECDSAVCHGSELPFVFFSARPGAPIVFDSDEMTLSYEMMSYWGNFAWSNNPNNGTTTPTMEWPQYAWDTKQNIRFATPTNTLMTDMDGTHCDYFDEIGYFHGESLMRELSKLGAKAVKY